MVIQIQMPQDNIHTIISCAVMTGVIMKFDVIFVGAGPAGYFAAYELNKLKPELKIALIDGGNPIEKRRCPILEHKLTKCPLNPKGFSECYPACSITNGFGGAGAYSDGKFNITTENVVNTNSADG